MSDQYITRAELALRLDVSKDTVRRNEKTWGIWAFRRQLGPYLIKFKRTPTLTLLKAKGLID